MRIFRACRCRHLRRGGRVLWAATSQSGSSLSFSLMILPLHSFHALVVVVFKLSQFVDNCNDCFCLFINWYDDNRLHNAKQEREREREDYQTLLYAILTCLQIELASLCVLCLFSCCRRRRRCCCCCTCLSFYVLRCGCGCGSGCCLLLITCIFTLRFNCMCVCAYRVVCFITKISARACVYTH